MLDLSPFGSRVNAETQPRLNARLGRISMSGLFEEIQCLALTVRSDHYGKHGGVYKSVLKTSRAYGSNYQSASNLYTLC